uniref:Gag-pol polyprotein n=2 Tax=Oryza sativa subsp. japonica TaxID=39947 RepID=Q7G3M0_ORYSJ|nr:Putative gag-pol polyprotein [Oryza sativa Japonica Group]AAP53180.1 hypothetical protein LOC_Os10g20670 [Oryza sativa Japonica Group]
MAGMDGGGDGLWWWLKEKGKEKNGFISPRQSRWREGLGCETMVKEIGRRWSDRVPAAGLTALGRRSDRHMDGAMPPRTRRGRREPTLDPVSENEESNGDEYVQSDDEVMENIEGDEVEVSGDCDAMKWMSGTLRCSINCRAFKELLHIHFNNRDDLHDEQNHNPFPIDHFSQFYEEGRRHTYGKVVSLRAIPSLINRIVRATILPRCGNNDDICGVAWHVIEAIMDGRRFGVINLMMKEIAISKGTIGQGVYYAPYIMRLIQSKLRQIGNNLKEHKDYKPHLQLSTPRAPRVRQPTFDQGASSSAAPLLLMGMIQVPSSIHNMHTLECNPTNTSIRCLGLLIP